MIVFRLAQYFMRNVVAGAIPAPDSASLSASFPTDDENEIAFEMLDYLGDNLSPALKSDQSLRLHAALYLAYLRASSHASWQDYKRGHIGDLELAYIAEKGAGKSRLAMAQYVGGAVCQPE